MPVTISEIHRIDAGGSRRVAEVYPAEDRVTPICVHLSDLDFTERLLTLDIVVRPPAPFLDAPPAHRPDTKLVHRGAPQRNYFTTVGLEQTLEALLRDLPREGLPRYEVRQRVQATKY